MLFNKLNESAEGETHIIPAFFCGDVFEQIAEI